MMAGSLPLHFARKSCEIGSDLGGSSTTGSLGSNFPAMVETCGLVYWEKEGK